MPHRPTFEYNPLSYAFPDDESDKELFFLQASGEIAASHLRTVLLYWVNKVFSDGEEVWQVVRLDRGEGGAYKYVYPDLIVVDASGRTDHGQGIGHGHGHGIANGHGYWSGHANGVAHSHGAGHGHDREHEHGQPAEDEERDELFSLGTLTRDQREALLDYAEEIEYFERAVEEECLRWMSRLLEWMIKERMVKRAVVDAIRCKVALPS